MLPVVTWAVFFLCLDRLLLICWPVQYTCQRQNKMFKFATAFLVLVHLFNFWAYTLELPLLHNYDCLAFNCFIQKTGSQGFIYSKILGGFCVIQCSLVFVYQLKWKHNKQLSEQQLSAARKTVNRLVLLQMCTEITLNFTPQVIVILTFRFTGIVVGTYIGSQNWLFGSVDAFISAVVYSYTMRRVLKRKELWALKAGSSDRM